MPSFNAAQTIERAVRSCLAQSVPPFEMLVIDDHSKDETLAILRQFKDQVSVIALPENSGPAAARNAGIRQAKGDFIAFLDADDFWLPDKLKIVTEVLQQRAEVHFLYHDFEVTGEEKVLPGEKAQAVVADIRAQHFGTVLLRNPMATPCVVVRRQEGLWFDERLHYMEDYELWLRLAANQKIWHLPMVLTVLGRPVLSAGGQSSRRWEMRKGELKVYSRLAWRRKTLLPLLPFLWAFSLLKHLRKSVG